VEDQSLSSEAFCGKYMARNEPVIIKGLLEEWRAWKEWRSAPPQQEQLDRSGSSAHGRELDASIAFDHLRKNFGMSKVCVAQCNNKDFSDQKRVEMTLEEYIRCWQDGMAEGLYLKDWHLPKEYKSYKAYEVADHFADDWMNLYADETSTDDFRFCYMGPKGTWTPLHRDVYCSYSWSSNVVGFKYWILFPEKYSRMLIDENGNCVYDVTDSKYTAAKSFAERFPRFQTALSHCRVAFQSPGETIFVPSGWYHQVYNVTDAISINHNWFNGWSLPRVWNHIKDELKLARQTLEGFTFDSFSSLVVTGSESKSSSVPKIDNEAVQNLMTANTGIGCEKFVSLLCLAAKHKIRCIESQSEVWKVQSAKKAHVVLVSIFEEMIEGWSAVISKESMEKVVDSLVKIRNHALRKK